ncbi:MAG: TadE/TadG family type IV pilus assembly protein [Anaerolineales bacterium]
MMKKIRSAQSMVEFALVLPVLLVLVMTLLEASRIFQAYLAVGYAAREAARYAITGSPPMMIAHGEDSCQELGHPVTGAAYTLPNDYQQCRIDWIIHTGRETAKPGLLMAEFETDVTKPAYLGVFVRGSPNFGAAPTNDHAGVPRTTVEVMVVFNHPVTSPVYSMLLPTIRITRHVRMVNEPWDGGGPEVPPDVPPADPLPPLDTDGDGWSDDDERNIHGTLPSNPDTDDDGYYDGDGTLEPVDPEPLDPCDPDPGFCET